MEPRITLLTLGVADLERSICFYRDGLGLPTEGIIGREFEHGAVAFFPLAGGLKLALWAQADLAFDTGLPQVPISPTSFALAHNVRSREEVDGVMAAAGGAGATIVRSTAGMPGIFRTRTGICGRWRGIPRCCLSDVLRRRCRDEG
jgi:catechol 2,3-dioxygenase-like lactoylglutathione lyase family enzyme